MLSLCLSSYLVEPYVKAQYHLAQFSALSQGNVIIMISMLGLICLFPLSFFNYGRNVKVSNPICGRCQHGRRRLLHGSGGTVRDMSMRNYYLAPFFRG
jgi:hypothetical protein